MSPDPRRPDRTTGRCCHGTLHHPQLLDPALVRAGRFDTKIILGLPGVEDLAALFGNCRRPELIDVDFIPLATRLIGSSAADVAQIVRDARRRACRRGGKLAHEDLEAVVSGSSPPVPPHVAERVAVHEVGHALTAALNGLKVREISIGRASGGDSPFGGTAWIDLGMAWLGTWTEIEAAVRVLLGGRAAEMVLFGNASAGAAEDLERATGVVVRALSSAGLGDTLFSQPASTPTADLIGVVETHLQRLHAEVESQLRMERSVLIDLAIRLQQSRHLKGDVVAPYVSVDAWMQRSGVNQRPLDAV